MMNAKRILKEVQNQIRSATSIRVVTNQAKIGSSTPENIHLFTHARGGSTLLAEVISNNVKSPIVWEPFFKGRKPFSQFDHRALWGWKEYVDQNATESSIDEFFNGIITRQYLNPRFFTGQSIQGLHHSNQLVFKYCHANFLAPYLIEKFNLKAILLDRHICQIIASRKKYGGFMKGRREYPLGSSQSKNNSQIFQLHQKRRNEAIRSSVGEHAWNYCLIRTLHKQIPNENVLRLDFNDMIQNPAGTSSQLNSFLGTTIQADSFSTDSRTSVEKTTNKLEHLNKWKTRLTESEIQEIRNIVHGVFNFHEINFD